MNAFNVPCTFNFVNSALLQSADEPLQKPWKVWIPLLAYDAHPLDDSTDSLCFCTGSKISAALVAVSVVTSTQVQCDHTFQHLDFSVHRELSLCVRALHGVTACDGIAATATQTQTMTERSFITGTWKNCIIDGCIELETEKQYRRYIFFISPLSNAELKRSELTGHQVFTNCTTEGA